ncbi:MarR family winged helix-turn-helix transcriptional regulator [Falsihalocynthiibacter sp. SS001]|uniref:MarR family winged helix-turn-helix transcriptional regulator n=1 Tax=Falsihalocynthiibacter sp. SS001 TaxID=3349698 RepID=UPI0036D43E2F
MLNSDVAAAVLLETIVRATYTSREPGALLPMQWSILRFLARVPEEQRSAKMITKFLGIPAAPTSRAVQGLVKRKLVKQEKSLEDARSFRLVLLPDAKKALEQDPLLQIAKSVANLPDEEKQLFKKSLETIVMDIH